MTSHVPSSPVNRQRSYTSWTSNNELEFFHFFFCCKFPSFLFPPVGRRLLFYLSRRVHPKKSRHITERRCAFTESPARWWPLTCASRPTTSHPPSANEFLSTSTVSLNISDWISFIAITILSSSFSHLYVYQDDAHNRDKPRATRSPSQSQRCSFRQNPSKFPSALHGSPLPPKSTAYPVYRAL